MKGMGLTYFSKGPRTSTLNLCVLLFRQMSLHSLKNPVIVPLWYQTPMTKQVPVSMSGAGAPVPQGKL